MLNIDGALAVFNGLLVATGKIWCECVRGGTCCGGECRCDEGVCCNEVWHTDEDPDEPCGEGEVFLQWGENNRCCGCVPEVIFDGREQENVNTADVVGDLCCPVCVGSPLAVLPFSAVDGAYIGCLGRCCAPEGCTNTLAADCVGEWLGECCESLGCPKSCCTENSSGVVSCETVDELSCLGIVDPEPCETACKGACCIDGELTENSPVTQAECDEVDGCWWGVGSTECEDDGFCRAPFDENCCETVTSSAERLTFRGPRKKRCPELDGCGFQVTVAVTTGSPVYVHGGLFGSPYEACTDIVTFLLCNDEFHVTPAPCSGNLQNLNIEVCWEDAVESESEILRFHCCQNITYLLSNSGCDCVTTLLYEGGGCTSNAAIVLGGDAIIDASGTGALVLTTTVVGGTPEKTLTLTGPNADGNTINGISGDGVSVVKEGTGLWRMNAATKQFDGTLTVTQGFIHMSNPAAVNDDTITIGNTSASSAGVAAYLLEQGVSRDAASGIEVLASSGSQVVYLGGANTSGSSTFRGEIRMDRDVTLVAATGGTVDFSSTWAGPTSGSLATRNVTIGAPGYAGTAELFNFGALETTGTVTIAAGDVVSGFDTILTAGGGLFLQSATSLRITKTSGGIASTTTVTAATATLTLEPEVGNPAVSVSLDDLVVTGTLTLDGSGSLTIASSLSGGGSIVVTSGTLTLDAASDRTGSVSANGGSVVVNDLVDNPGSLVTSATLTSGSLTVAFSGDPSPGAEYVLLAGPTVQTYGSVTLTGTAVTGTYNSATSTLTID